MMQDQGRGLSSGDDSFTSTTAATPELVFTGPCDDAASSSESVCSEADCSACCQGQVVQLDEDHHLQQHIHSSSQTAQKGVPGRGTRQGQTRSAARSVKFAVDSKDCEAFNAVDQPRLPQPQQSGAPATTTGQECGGNSSDYNATRNSTVCLDSSKRKRETTTTTNNDNKNSGTVYRQSSLKWKQRNGSATFELNLSQEEFMGIHRHGGREQEA